MNIDSKLVKGRRNLRFHSLDEVVSDAEKLVAASNTKMLGNWPLNRILGHLATAINGSLDGVSAKAPWFVRLVGGFFKGRILKNKMSPGFKLPKNLEADFFPDGPTNQEALDILRNAVARSKKQQMTASHPVFGKLTHDEWTQLHLRHSELHLSFANIE